MTKFINSITSQLKNMKQEDDIICHLHITHWLRIYFAFAYADWQSWKFQNLRFVSQMQNMYLLLLQNIDSITNQYYVSPIEQLLFAHRWWRDDIDSGLLRLSSMLIVLPTGGAALPPTTTSLDWLTIACFAVLHRICYKKQIPPCCRMKARRLEKAQSPMLYCNHFTGKPVTYFPVTSAIGVYYLSPLHIALWVILGAPCRALTDNMRNWTHNSYCHVLGRHAFLNLNYYYSLVLITNLVISFIQYVVHIPSSNLVYNLLRRV